MKKLNYYLIMIFVLSTGILSTFGLKAQHPNVNRDSIRIITPLNEDSVKEKQLIRGFISRNNSIVWVIVHPMETSDYWVQQQATASTGSWNCLAYFGRAGSIDKSKYFEFRAITNPSEPLSNGQKIGSWPNAEIISDVILVIRK